MIYVPAEYNVTVTATQSFFVTVQNKLRNNKITKPIKRPSTYYVEEGLSQHQT